MMSQPAIHPHTLNHQYKNIRWFQSFVSTTTTWRQKCHKNHVAISKRDLFQLENSDFKMGNFFFISVLLFLVGMFFVGVVVYFDILKICCMQRYNSSMVNYTYENTITQIDSCNQQQKTLYDCRFSPSFGGGLWV